MRSLVLSTSLAFLVAAGSSCASIVSKSEYGVTLRSEPSGAAFLIHDEDGNEVDSGLTPSTVTLKAGSAYFDREEYRVTFSSPGLPEKTVDVAATLDPWFLGNILFGGLIGILIVDPLTGAMYKLDDEVVVYLNGSAEPASAEAPAP